MPTSMHDAKVILDETGTAYFILWEGVDASGNSWDPTWVGSYDLGSSSACVQEPKKHASPALVAEWENVKRVKQGFKREGSVALRIRAKREGAPDIEDGNIKPLVPRLAIAPQVLWGLSKDILSQIAWNVAPLGGKDAALLRLVCKAFDGAAKPVVWASVFVRRRADVARLVEDSKSTTTFIKSFHYEISESVDIIVTFLKTLPRLYRLHLTAGNGDFRLMPEVLAKSLRHLPIKALELMDIQLDLLPAIRIWIPKLDLLVLRGRRETGLDSHGLFGGRNYDSKKMSKPHLDVRQLVFRGYPDPCRTLCSAQALVESMELDWDGWRNTRVLDAMLKYAAWDSPARKPFSIRIHGLKRLFQGHLPNKQKRITITFVKLLNCVGAGPLWSLTLPLHTDVLVPHMLLGKLVLPRLRVLTIATEVKTGDILDKSFAGLVALIESVTLPSLTSLHLEGWLKPETIEEVSRIPRTDLAQRHLHIFALLATLSAHRMSELRLRSTSGAVECVYRLDETDRWNVRLDRFTVRGTGVERELGDLQPGDVDVDAEDVPDDEQ